MEDEKFIYEVDEKFFIANLNKKIINEITEEEYNSHFENPNINHDNKTNSEILCGLAGIPKNSIENLAMTMSQDLPDRIAFLCAQNFIEKELKEKYPLDYHSYIERAHFGIIY